MDIRIPHLGEGADSGTVVNVFVRVGDKVTKDQTVLELENEKAVAPIPSPQAGTVTKILVKAGDKVSVGQAILSLDGEGSGASSAEAPRATQSAPVSVAAPVSPMPVVAQVPGNFFQSPSGLEPPSSPSVRKLAQELGIDLRRVPGSEAGGRITSQDLRNYIQNLIAFASQPAAAQVVHTPVTKAVAPSVDFSKWGSVNKKAASSLRQKIAEKMVESWSTIPHVTQFDEADITDLMVLRKKHAPAYEKKGGRLTLTAFAIKAVVAALKKHPVFNASYDENTHEVVYKEYFNVGVAVDTEQGLIVPVLKNVDKKSLLEISKELEVLAEKTRQRKISADDLKGGTFTISNLGSIGGTHFTPIINKPELAILGIGKGVLKPRVVEVAKKQKIEARLMMPVAVSYDHRIIDGADGARFIRVVVESLQNFSEKEIKL